VYRKPLSSIVSFISRLIVAQMVLLWRRLLRAAMISFV
jgi:hypothetical protein